VEMRVEASDRPDVDAMARGESVGNGWRETPTRRREAVTLACFPNRRPSRPNRAKPFQTSKCTVYR
jgi:hypothetical protein